MVLRLCLLVLFASASLATAHANWVEAGFSGERIRGLVEIPSGVRFASTSAGLSRSLDGGATWTSIEATLFGDAFDIVTSPDSNLIFIAVETGVYRSGDQGESWIFLGESIGGTYSLAIAPNRDVYAAGSSGTWRSTNRGLSWSKVHDANGNFTDGLVIDQDGRVFLMSIFAELFRSDDHGESWVPMTPNLEFKTSLAVSARTGTILAGTQTFDTPSLLSVYRSTDHGETWQLVIRRAGGLDAVSFLSNGEAFAGADIVLHSTDDGQTWVPRNQGLPLDAQVDCFAQIQGQVFMGTRLEGLWREADLIVSTPRSPSRSGLRLSVSPSPFRTRAVLQFLLPVTGRVRLEVFGLHGERVAQVADGEFTAGLHTVSLDASGLTPSLYFARLTQGADAVAVPLILLK